MIILLNALFGEAVTNYMFELLERFAVNTFEVIGVYLIMGIGLALLMASLVTVHFHVGGMVTFAATAIIHVIIGVFAIKWIVLTLIIGIPGLILSLYARSRLLARGTNRHMANLALWAMLMLVI